MTVSKSRFKRRFVAGAKMLVHYPGRILAKVALSAVVVDSKIDREAALDSRVRFYRSDIGRCSYVARGAYVESTSIGSFCSIGGDCNIGGASHPLSHVSTSPVFHSGGNILGKVLCPIGFDPFERTVIENDVWIGNGAKIKAGVRIATGAVVGMGSVLTKDVGPYEIWAGNPARLIRKRFDDETIGLLLGSRWWELSDEELRRLGDAMADPECLLDGVLA